MATGSEPVHPAAEIFPMMPADELEQLAKDIKANGQREPIVYFQGKLLDGRNRKAACKIAGVDPETCEIDEENFMGDKFDPVAYVLSTNLHRRHLDTGQRSMVGARAKGVYSEEAKERQKRKPKSVVANLPQQKEMAPKARDQAAAAVSVSGKSIDHATTVLEKGSPELIAAVDSGEVAVSKAAKVAKAKPKKQQLAEATKKTEPSEKTPFDHLCHWWAKADSAGQTRFRLWIDGDCT